MSQSNACTIVLPGKADRIYVNVRLYAGERYYDAKALWDTGAGSSHISEAAVNALLLKDYGVSMCTSASNCYSTTRHIVTIQVFDFAIFKDVLVRKLSPENTEDMILGMDVIRHFDSVISSENGRVFFSIRYPSKGAIDFCAET